MSLNLCPLRTSLHSPRHELLASPKLALVDDKPASANVDNESVFTDELVSSEDASEPVDEPETSEDDLTAVRDGRDEPPGVGAASPHAI